MKFGSNPLPAKSIGHDFSLVKMTIFKKAALSKLWSNEKHTFNMSKQNKTYFGGGTLSGSISLKKGCFSASLHEIRLEGSRISISSNRSSALFGSLKYTKTFRSKMYSLWPETLLKGSICLGQVKCVFQLWRRYKNRPIH